VGLRDALTDDQISAAERLDDGLPQSLRACIKRYGLTHFKIKLGGDVAGDLDRLRGIAWVLEESCGSPWACTLDANENYRQVGAFRELWQRVVNDPTLTPFVSRVLFVEQPLHRDVALSEDVEHELRGWNDRPAMIIDESGGTLADLPRALECGYGGTSHKNCKGVMKGIGAACFLEWHRRNASAGALPGRHWILSAEDLSNTGPVALVQDLAVVAALGIDHAERNGHHYFRGLSGWSRGVQSVVAQEHSDVYAQHADGIVALAVAGGRMNVRTVNDTPSLGGAATAEQLDGGGFSDVTASGMP
jgi:hypothetical protein